MKYIVLSFLGLVVYASSAYYFQEFNLGYVADFVALIAGWAGIALMCGSLIVAFYKAMTPPVQEGSDIDDVTTESLVKAGE